LHFTSRNIDSEVAFIAQLSPTFKIQQFMQQMLKNLYEILADCIIYNPFGPLQ